MRGLAWVLYFASAACWVIAEIPDIWGWLCWILLAIGFVILDQQEE